MVVGFKLPFFSEIGVRGFFNCPQKNKNVCDSLTVFLFIYLNIVFLIHEIPKSGDCCVRGQGNF